MSQEVFELVKELDLSDIETQLAMQCAPVIMKLKVSNLFIISEEEIEKVKEILDGSELSSQILLVKEGKAVFLVYRQEYLREYLSEEGIRKLLRKLGYRKMELEELLPIFIRRYSWYCRYGGNFPHEMGLLLGYPIEDVIGFIKNKGKNFLYTGYWKVYENIGEEIQLFQKFERAKQLLLQLVAMGISMTEVIQTERLEKRG